MLRLDPTNFVSDNPTTSLFLSTRAIQSKSQEKIRKWPLNRLFQPNLFLVECPLLTSYMIIVMRTPRKISSWLQKHSGYLTFGKNTRTILSSLRKNGTVNFTALEAVLKRTNTRHVSNHPCTRQIVAKFVRPMSLAQGMDGWSFRHQTTIGPSRSNPRRLANGAAAQCAGKNLHSKIPNIKSAFEPYIRHQHAYNSDLFVYSFFRLFLCDLMSIYVDFLNVHFKSTAIIKQTEYFHFSLRETGPKGQFSVKE